MYIDFKAIKAAVSVEQAMIHLELKGFTAEKGHYRGECPACRAGSRSLEIFPETNSFYCHASKKGGDVISFVAHVHGTSMKDAAGFLNDKLSRKEEKVQKEPVGDLQKILADLIHDHPSVQSLGLSVEDAERLDIGYKSRGLYKGQVVGPARTADGHTVAVAPLAKDFTFPKVLQWPNVVPLKRRA